MLELISVSVAEHEVTRSISTPPQPPPPLDGMLVHYMVTHNIDSADNQYTPGLDGEAL